MQVLREEQLEKRFHNLMLRVPRIAEPMLACACAGGRASNNAHPKNEIVKLGYLTIGAFMASQPSVTVEMVGGVRLLCLPT